MKQTKKLISLIAIISILASMFMYMPVASAFNWDNDNAPQRLDQNSAYATFGTNAQTINATITYSSGTPTTVTYGGVSGVQLASGQKMYIQPTASSTNYVVVVKFYDPGSSASTFDVQYKEGSTTRTRKIQKTGMEAKWVTESFVATNVSTSNYIGNNSKFCISGDSLVISKVEVISYQGAGATAAASDITVNKSSGSGYSYITSSNPLIKPYITAQSWNYQGTKFIFKTLKNSQYSLYEYDIVNEKVTKLDTGIAKDEDLLSAVVTYDNQIYYAKADGTTWKMDWLTYKAEQQANARSFYSPSVTNDGEWMTGVLKNWGNENRQLLLENTKTGEAKSVSIVNARNSWSSGSFASHPQVNPEYPHLVSVAHDNDESSVVHSRIWLANFNTDTTYNMFVQAPNGDGTTGEPSGHEIWGANGENMYWVKFESSTAGQTGIMRTDKYGATREYINGDYDYWHCFPSMDDNWVVADANPDGSTDSIVLINTNTYTSTVVASFRNYGTQHPNQPHPHISGNNYSANWQLAPTYQLSGSDNNTSTSIGWAVVRDVTKGAKAATRQSMGVGTEIITSNGAANATSEVNNFGDSVTYKYAANGKGVYIDILNDYCASTNADVTLEISYRDTGSNPLVVKYTSGVDDIADLTVREDKTYSITKNNSNSLKKATVTLENANINNAGKFRSDLYISSTDGAYISKVDVKSVSSAGSDMYNKAMIYSYPADFGVEHSSGLEIRGTSSSYNANLWHVNNKEGWTSDGITEDAVNDAKNKSATYISKDKDGAWAYRNVTDKDGITKTVYFTTKNYKSSTDPTKRWITNGTLYFNVRGNVITESDNTVTFAVTYLDFAKDTNITVSYVTGDQAENNFTIAGTGTGKWKTAYATVTDAKMSSTNTKTLWAFNTEDIKISYAGDMNIASVCIMKDAAVADEDLSIQSMYYNNRDIVVKAEDRVVASAENNVTSAGIVATGLENNENYDSTLYHVDDVTEWTNAGFTESDITTAKNAGCNYVTLNKDGAWMYKEFEDNQGVIKNTFYAPFNWRKSNGASELSNIYFRLTDDTIIHSDSNIVIAVEYLDNGGTLDVTYVSRTGLNTVRVVGTHTGLWKTAYIKADDAAISSHNSETALALGSEDIKIAADQTPIASVTVMKQYDGTAGVAYEVLGGTSDKLAMQAGDIGAPVVVVKNNSDTDMDVNLYKVVYNADSTMKSVEKSSTVTVQAGSIGSATTSESILLKGETQEVFAWDGTLTPIEQGMDPLGVVISSVEGSVKLNWKNNFWAGHFINVYSDGELVGRTNGNYCILDNLETGDNELVVDVVDTYGKVVFRSKPIIATVE